MEAAGSGAAVAANVGSATVPAEWLRQNLGSVKVLDASWYMPAEKRDPQAEYEAAHIPGALFFDVDGISDPNTDLPHMLPTAAAFAAAATALGLRADDDLVVYDGKGLFSAARAWWMFRTFGHERVRVLEGGLPRWRQLDYPLEAELPAGAPAPGAARAAVTAAYAAATPSQAGYAAKLCPDLLKDLEQVRENCEAGGGAAFQLVDARGRARFLGEEPEPRAGVRSGHVPGSKSVPFVLTKDGRLRSRSELAEVFGTAGLDLERPIVAACGTGVTACVLALALHELGHPDVAVYDGSWTEWGGHSDTPVSTGP
eukprot:SM000060S19655  [mRNA]  locus=s60:379437:381871:- [translate_table: standard]